EFRRVLFRSNFPVSLCSFGLNGLVKCTLKDSFFCHWIDQAKALWLKLQQEIFILVRYGNFKLTDIKAFFTFFKAYSFGLIFGLRISAVNRTIDKRVFSARNMEIQI